VTSLVRSEVIKLVSTRGSYGLIGGAVAVVLLGTFLTIMSADARTLHGPLHEQTFYVLASVNAAVFALVLGIKVFTDEVRYGTIITTFLSSGRRVRVLAAKVIVAVLAAAVLAVVTETAMASVALLLSSSRGAGFSLTSPDVTGMVGMVVALALWASIGVGLGAVVRHQVAAIVGGLLWILVVENLGSSLLGDSGRYLPGQAAHALARATEAGEALAVPLAATVLGAYVVITAFIGAGALVRRDVV
jgi:ABC-2 type transport system permease protein